MTAYGTEREADSAQLGDGCGSYMPVVATKWKARVFDRWEAVHDEAVAHLPEHRIWPAELMRVIFEAPCPTPKKLVLVLDKGVPVALTGVRARDRRIWEPLTHYIVPGFLMVGDQRLTASVMAGMPFNLKIGWWRMSWPFPRKMATVRSVSTATTHLVSIAGAEEYWRKSGFWRTAKAAKRKSEQFDFVLNPKDGVRWSLENWEAKWRSDPAVPRADLAARLAAYQYLQDRGQYLVFGLTDGPDLIAAETCIREGDDLVGVIKYHRNEYRNLHVGHGLAVRAIEWARQEGLNGYDIGGGGYDYKHRFAPPGGIKEDVHICPQLHYRCDQVMGHCRALRHALHPARLARYSLQRLRQLIS